MNDDPLRQLLKDADVTAVGSTDPRALAASVRERHRGQQRTIRTAGTAAVVLIALAGVTASLVRHPAKQQQIAIAPSPVPPSSSSVAPQHLAALDLDARLHELTAQKLTEMHGRPTSKPVAGSGLPSAAEIQLQRDRAALLIVYEADQNAQSNRTTLAAAGYRRAIELFPQTHWADVARQRLKELQT